MTNAITNAAVRRAPAAAERLGPDRRRVERELSQNEFLKLFVAQLQHQDPLSPMGRTADGAAGAVLEPRAADGDQPAPRQHGRRLEVDRHERPRAHRATVTFDGAQLGLQGKIAPVDYTAPTPR
jgi:hypothetical protein